MDPTAILPIPLSLHHVETLLLGEDGLTLRADSKAADAARLATLDACLHPPVAIVVSFCSGAGRGPCGGAGTRPSTPAAITRALAHAPSRGGARSLRAGTPNWPTQTVTVQVDRPS